MIKKFMTGIEWDNFFANNERKYILEENSDFVVWRLAREMEGFHSILNIKQMQTFIDYITVFYEFKYPNELLNEIESKDVSKEKERAKETSKLLDTGQLKYRLHNDCFQFLKCSQMGLITLRRKREKLLDRISVSLNVDDEGFIDIYDALDLVSSNYIERNRCRISSDKLLEQFENSDTTIDYSELKESLDRHKFNVSIRDKVLSLVPFSMFYSSNPYYGYMRAKSFVRDFNEEFDTNLNLLEIDKIMEKDYSKKEKVNVK